MEPMISEERIRKELIEYFSQSTKTYKFYAELMDMSQHTLLRFIHNQTKPSRLTLVKAQKFLDSIKNN